MRWRRVVVFRMSQADPDSGPTAASTTESGPRTDASTALARDAVTGVGRSSTANLVGSAVMAASTFLLTLVVTRGLPKAEAGLFFAATSVFILLTSLGQLGTNTALVYFLARSRSLAATERIRHYVRLAVRPVILTGVVVGVGLFVLADPVARVVSPDHVHITARYLRALALFIPLAGYENVILAASRGLGVMRPSVLVEQVGRSVIQLVLVAAAVWLSSERYLGLAWVVGYLPAALWAGWWYRSIVARRRHASTADVHHAELRREFWRFSGPRALASVGQVTMQRLDIILVAAITGPVAAAVYTAATRFVVVGQMANRAISTAVQPRLSEALARHDVTTTNLLYRVSTGWLMLLTWPLYLSLIIYGERLLSVFGRGYQAGHVVLVLLASSMLLSTGCGMVDMVLNMGGRTTWNLANVMLALTVNLGLDLWLIPGHGILGAAIGWAAAIAVSNLAALLQVAVILGLHPFGRSTSLAVALPTLCFAGVPLIVRLGLGGGILGFVVGVSASLLVYAILLWLARVPLELAQLVAVRRKPRGSSSSQGPGATGQLLA